PRPSCRESWAGQETPGPHRAQAAMTRTSLPGWPALNRGADEPGSRKNLIRNRPERAARLCLLQPQLGRRVRSDTAAYASGPAREVGVRRLAWRVTTPPNRIPPEAHE